MKTAFIVFQREISSAKGCDQSTGRTPGSRPAQRLDGRPMHGRWSMFVCWGSSPEASPELSRSVRPHAETAIGSECSLPRPELANAARRSGHVASLSFCISDRSSDTASTKILTTNPILLPHTRPTPPTPLLFRSETQSFPLCTPRSDYTPL
jgi:hypothetical protein